MAARSRTGEAGFTLLELLVVLLIVGLVAAIAAPNVVTAVTRAREAALAENLAVMRRAIDDYYSDTGTYPPTLEQLVDGRYLRHLPDNPFGDAGWVVLVDDNGTGVADIRSAEEGEALDGSRYGDW